MLKKALHRITVVWCLYGLVRVCIFLNPLLIRLFRLVGSDKTLFGLDKWDEIAMMWFITAVCIAILIGISAAIHHFANWFFNTASEEEDE